jgi:hypothetical protein
MIHLDYVLGLFVWSGSVKIFQRVPPCLITMQPLSSRLLRVCTCASALPTPSSIPFFFFERPSMHSLIFTLLSSSAFYPISLSLSPTAKVLIRSNPLVTDTRTHSHTHTHIIVSPRLKISQTIKNPLPLPSNLIQPFYVLDFASCPKLASFFLIISLYPTWIITAGKDQKSKWIKGEKTSRICFFSFSLVFKK